MARRVRPAPFHFQPFSRKQKQVLTWWMPESGVSEANGIIADGSIRSGKTVCMGLAFVMWAMETFHDENLGICGKTVGSCRRNVISPLKKMLTTRGYRYKDHLADQMLEISKDGVTNLFYLFGGHDERSQDLIQGITLAGVLLDEVALMPESFVNQATGRCSVEGSKYWLNCNPAGPQHWVKKKWIDQREEKDLLYIHFTLDDNLSLSDKIKARYRAMYTGVFYKRYILGLWAAAEGIIYGMYERAREARYAPASDDGELMAARDYALSIDYGTLNAFAAGLWAYDGRTWHMTDEYYYSGRETGVQKTDAQYVVDVENFVEKCIPPSAWPRIRQDGGLETIVDPSAASFITALNQRSDRFLVRPAINNVLDGIRDTCTCLETGIIKISDSCARTYEEFGGYVWEDDPSQDRPVKENDHSMDQIRYMVETKQLADMVEEYNSVFGG